MRHVRLSADGEGVESKGGTSLGKAQLHDRLVYSSTRLLNVNNTPTPQMVTLNPSSNIRICCDNIQVSVVLIPRLQNKQVLACSSPAL